MSRTKRGGKAPGFEFWSARPGNRHGNLMGRDAKRFTHSKERRDGKSIVSHELLLEVTQ